MVSNSEINVGINITPTQSHDNVKYLAIAIGGCDCQRHVGFYLRSEDEDKLKFLHHGWHYRFRLDDPEDKYGWVEFSDLNEVTQGLLVDWLIEIWKINGNKIPYSVNHDPSSPYFSKGKYVRNNPGEGLTCATFVMQSLADFGLQIIDCDSWQARPEDSCWRTNMIGFLEKTHPPKPSEEDIEIQRGATGEFRYRPEEVAYATALYKNEKIGFAQATKGGEVVLEKMKHLGLMARFSI